MKSILLFLFLFLNTDLVSQILISTGGSVPVNNGDILYDSGGAAGNDNNTSYTITLTPAIAGERICLEFTAFNTYYSGSNSGDFVKIYDAITATASAQIAEITGDFSTFTATGGMGVKVTNGLSAYNTPGIFCSNNAAGSLTVTFQNNNGTTSPGFAALIKTYKPLGTPGCSITLAGSPSSICSGQTVTLTATGNIVSSSMNNDFNAGTVGTGWQATASANFTNPVCAVTGQDGIAHATTFLWMSNAVIPRNLTTNAMDVSNGGTISFDYRQGIQASASPCEGPDLNFSGLTPEGVYLQYSTNAGTTWTTINYLFPRDDNENSFGNWYPGTGRFNESWHTKICPIPAAASTTSTMFRWTQQIGTSSTTDSWGLDNVVIASPKATTITITNLTTGNTVGTSTTSPFTITDAPLVTTNYQASITDGTTTCTFPLTITVTGTLAPPTVSNISYCQNSTAIALIATAITGNTLNWYGTNATGGTASPTAPTPLTTTAGTTTYYVSQITSGGCESPRVAIIVTIDATPILTINTPVTVCSPTTVNLTLATVTAGSTGGGTLTYWTNLGATTSMTTPTVATSGTYYIQAANGTCTDIEAVTVTINTTPVLTINTPATVCSPTTVNLTLATVTTGSTGSGTITYWTDLAATTSFTAPTVATSGTYYIQSANGTCSDIEAVTVTITTSPNLIITDPTAVCEPLTINITLPAITNGSTGGGTLSYWTDASATIALVNPTLISISGIYFIKSTNGACTDINPVNVLVNNCDCPLDLIITNPTAVCSPLIVDLTLPAITVGSTGGGALTYWTDLACTNPLASPNAIGTQGTYYIKSDNLVCSDIEAVTVTINLTPILTINNPTAVCSPLTVNITLAAITNGTTNPGTISYWADAAGTISLLTPNAIAIASSYYIKSTLSGCSDIDPVLVSITPTPVLTIIDPSSVCPPGTVDITQPATTAGSTGGGTLSYWTDAAGTIALTTPAAITTSGIYYIKSTSGTCTDINPVNVLITAPVLVTTNPSAVCAPSTVDITQAATTFGSTGGGILSYWTNAAGTIALLSPTAVTSGGTYYIKATSGTCSDIESILVTINTTPVLTINDPASVCSPLTVDITSAAITSGSSGGGALTYWTNATATSSLTNPSAIASSNTYYIKSTSGVCSDINPVVVTINTTPVLLITDPSAVCDPTTVNITTSFTTAGSTGNGILTYWQDLGATISVNNPSTINVTGIYYIQSTLGSCSDIEPVNVSINSAPTLLITDPIAVCSPLTVDITLAGITNGSTAGATYTYWTNILATTILSNPSAVGVDGTYYVKSTLLGCSTVLPLIVTINPSANANFNPSKNEISNLNTIVSFSNTSTNATLYAWDFGDGDNSIAVNTSHTFPNETEAIYTVTLIANNSFNCPDTAIKTIKVYEDLLYFIPNTFTPDDDKYNQLFMPIVTAGYLKDTYEFTIFNRWGEIIFNTKDLNEGWNGTTPTAEESQDGTYTWQMYIKDSRKGVRHIFVGHVNLIR